MIGLTLDTVLSDPGVRHAFDVAHQDIVAMGRTDLTHVVRAVLAVLPQEGPTRAEVEALRDFAQEFADEPCFFGDNCPTFGSRHGRCNNCKARNVLALFPKVTP